MGLPGGESVKDRLGLGVGDALEGSGAHRAGEIGLDPARVEPGVHRLATMISGVRRPLHGHYFA